MCLYMHVDIYLNTGTTICKCKSTYKDDHPYLKECIEKI